MAIATLSAKFIIKDGTAIYRHQQTEIGGLGICYFFGIGLDFEERRFEQGGLGISEQGDHQKLWLCTLNSNCQWVGLALDRPFLFLTKSAKHSLPNLQPKKLTGHRKTLAYSCTEFFSTFYDILAE